MSRLIKEAIAKAILAQLNGIDEQGQHTTDAEEQEEMNY